MIPVQRQRKRADDDAREELDVLIVGPAGHETGGVARYVTEHGRVLPSGVTARTYDVSTARATDVRSFLRAGATALGDALRFPLVRPADVVHVHTSHYFSFLLSAFYVLFAAYAWRRPVVLHVHGSSFDEFVAADVPLLDRFQSLVFGASDRVVVLSEYWREVLGERVDEGKLVVLPNAVDPGGYDPQYGADPPHLVFVSNHVARKGIRELTEAVDDLLRSGPEFEVTIAGSGPLARHAEDLAERFDRVTYVGYVPEAEKRSLLSRGSIYALPTRAEGLPIAILEAMAGGNAVVSTRVGSIPDVLGEENGVLVEPGDAGALRDGLRELLEDPERVERMARTNRELVETTYSWARTAAELRDLYADLGSRE